jgi:hypothetical protein
MVIIVVMALPLFAKINFKVATIKLITANNGNKITVYYHYNYHY